MKLSALFRKKSEVANAIAEHRANLLCAERALALCDRLAKELPGRIAALSAEPVGIAFTRYALIEDFTGRTDLIAQKRLIEATRALLSDLTAIRAHWVGVRDSLG